MEGDTLCIVPNSKYPKKKTKEIEEHRFMLNMPFYRDVREMETVYKLCKTKSAWMTKKNMAETGSN